MARSLDLTSLLPNRYRDKTIDGLLKNLFNRHLSKPDTVPLFGYVGDQLNLQPGEVQITEADLERQINQLTPFIYSEHASEKLIYSWYDLVQKLVTLDVDYATIQSWFKTKSYNFVPPIDLDKFCNYQDYFWIGNWVLASLDLDFTSLGLASATSGLHPRTDLYVNGFATWDNSSLSPEYYVIAKGPKDINGYPIAPQPTFPSGTWSDWSISNLWVHRDDIITFIQDVNGTVNFSNLIQATRPIIEYSCYLGLNTYQAGEMPADSGTLIFPDKKFKNQLPMFNLYNYNEKHAGIASSIFYYVEGQEYPIDPVIGRRLAKDVNSDFSFGHSLVNENDKSLYFYKVYDPAPATTSSLKTIWRAGPNAMPQYSKYDTSGTIINLDMFNNFKNYYWTGIDKEDNPSYNLTGLPEYYVIEKSGTSDWSKYNYWTHVSNLRRSDITKYVQATKPIIEFNINLESQLILSKTNINQLPKFNHYIDTIGTLINTSNNLNDAYLAGHLFARVSDLPVEIQESINTNPDVLKSCFETNGELYIQGLYAGAYYETDEAGVTYGFKSHFGSFFGVGDGSLTINDLSVTAGNFIIGKTYNILFIGTTDFTLIGGVNSVGTTFTATGAGSGTGIAKATYSYPELITLNCINPTTFSVTGSVTGAQPNLTVGTSYPISGYSLNITTGTIPFSTGDKFSVEINSYVYYARNLYINIDGNYRTLSSASEIINEAQNVVVIPSNPANQDGIWSTPPQLEWNVLNETRTELKEGDLYYHFISIIKAQPGLIGSATGNNNWRLISQDVGLGGVIKQYDGDTSLLISTLMQNGNSTIALIDFAKASYQGLSTSINSFVEDIIPDLLAQGKFQLPIVGDQIDPVVVETFKTYLAAQNPTVLTSSSVVDDTVSSPFYDTTSSLFNLIVTLPYIGLGTKTLPTKYYDLELNLNMLRHHDGHSTELTPDKTIAAKKIVQKSYVRSQGQETPGIISGFDYPQKPYAGQFWFKTTTGQLFLYNAVNDNAVADTLAPLVIWSNPGDITYSINAPVDAEYGAFAYNRSTNDIFQNNGVDSWAYLGQDPLDLALPWAEVRLDLISQNLELAIETELYNKCPTLSPVIDAPTLQSDSHFNTLMAKELEKFGVKYGAGDVYSPEFDENNAFTWNYSSVVAPGAALAHAAWQDVYLDVYGTARPDIEPWFGTTFLTEPVLLSAISGLITPGSTSFVPSMWTIPGVSSIIKAARIPANAALSVDISTGILIPPYDPINPEGLLTIEPTSASDPFAYGSGGPIERYWTRTLDYLYAEQKSYFKINPLSYVSNTWGIKHQVIGGEYELNPQLGRKEVPIDFILHGTPLSELAQPSWISSTINSVLPGSFIIGETYTIFSLGNTDFTLIGAPTNTVGISFTATGAGSGTGVAHVLPPSWAYTYTFTCVSRKDGIFKLLVTNDDAALDLTIGSPSLPVAPVEETPLFSDDLYVNFKMVGEVLTYSDKYITVEITPSLRGFFWGDAFTVTVDMDGNLTNSINPQANFKAEGFNQIFTQYGRIYEGDAQISLNSSLLNNWTIKLGYRFSGMINTDTLKINSQDIPIDESAYSILIKENQFFNSSWLNGLRVQLVQRGLTQLVNNVNVPATGFGASPGEDWIFRIDNFNKNRTSLSWYDFNTSGEQHTFIALDGVQTSYKWIRYDETTTIQTYSAPFLITGIQNLINFIFGYADKLYADGWRFGDPSDIKFNTETGRQLNYQLLVEQFIVQQFSGVDAGSAFIFNPFYRKIWYETQHGVVSGVFNTLGFENETTCSILDQNNKQIKKTDIRVFRQDALTEIVFDTPVYTLHLLTSEYEHVILLENYSTNTILLYDPFLGQRTTRLFFSGKKQSNFTGRIDFGGHFLLGDKMSRNVESSITEMSSLYDTTATDVDPNTIDRARAGLGYQKKSYFAERGTTDTTQFRFWQGMIANKGTNFSIDAFVNSASYQDSKLDEYWAYKIAEYGDSRSIIKTELIVQPEDCTGEYANFLFVEADDALPTSNDISNFFDAVPYDFGGYGSSNSIDPTGMTVISSTDESRWYSYSDLNKISYLEADPIAELIITPSAVGDCYVITDSNGIPVRADCFELINTNLNVTNAGYFITGTDYTILTLGTTDFTLIGAISNTVGISFTASGPGLGNGTGLVIYTSFHELGDYIVGSNPPEFTYPRFTRINQSVIKILDQTLVNKTFKVIAYGPASKQYSPNLLYDYVDNTLVKNDIIWWDPGRGVHHPKAAASISFNSQLDPALYTDSICQYKNYRVKKLKSWGAAQVGKIWWNTKDLHWAPYSDDKENPDFYNRLTRWGSLSDESSINVYEWVKSSVAPSSAPTGISMTGEPAVSYYVSRDRTWWQRPIAWKYSSNPDSGSRTFLVYQNRQRLQITTVGSTSVGQAVLKSGSFETLGVGIGSKISGASYSSTTKVDNVLNKIFGMAKVTAAPIVVVGSDVGYADGAIFASSINFNNFEVEIILNSLKFRTTYLGQYTLVASGTSYLILTHVDSGESQQLPVADLTAPTGQKLSFNFDKLGILISAKNITVNPTAVQIVAAFSSNPKIYLRSSVTVMVPMIFNDGTSTFTELFSDYDALETVSWIAWNDPKTNPINGVKPPLNQYQPLAGDWVQVGNYLHDISGDIITRIADPWTWFDGSDYTPYKSSWNEWRELSPVIIEGRYLMSASETYASFNSIFTFSGYSEQTLQSQTSVYLNEKKLVYKDQWNIDLTDPLNPMVVVIEALLKQGDEVRVKLNPYNPTLTELAFDPVESDTDPFQLVQYKLDYPYVKEILRDDFDNRVITNYYYWVKNKTTIGAPEQLSTLSIAQLLHVHGGMFAIPQKLKYFNELDGRPNRYSLLSIRDLGQEVRATNRFKLRLNKNPTLRSDDQDISLKPVHTEWKLLRPGQVNLIPVALWNTLTDTMAGSTLSNQVLPYTALSLYDQKNNSAVSYGVNDGQVMTKSNFAIDTVKHTILNTKVYKYENGVLVPDYISYTGFDINKLDEYLSSSDNIRKFMADIWRYAKPTQVNEIFFETLQDLAAASLELDMFFKTSLISLSDIRTITVTG